MTFCLAEVGSTFSQIQLFVWQQGFSSNSIPLKISGNPRCYLIPLTPEYLNTM